MKKLVLITALIIAPFLAFCQEDLVINGTTAVQIVENGGVNGSPIYIEIGNPAPAGITVIGTLGWIVSEQEFNKVKWDIGTNAGSYTVPFGYKALYYIPLKFTITTGGTGTGSILFSTWHTQNDNWTGAVSSNGPPLYVTNMNASKGGGQPSNTDDSYYVVDRFWIIDPYNNTYKYANAAAFPTLNPITFSYLSSGSTASEVGGSNVFTESTLQAQRFDTVGAVAAQTWGGFLNGTEAGAGGAVGTVTTSTPVGGASGNFYAPWTLSSSTDPLPITLNYFTCAPILNGFHLTWETATEQNNKYFSIERSNDGINFSTIATNIPGAGNSVTTKDYNYDDINPPTGFNYYRLSQTDDFGNTVYDNVSECESQDSVLVYPNPASGRFVVQLPLQALANPTTISLYDLLGRQIYNQTVQNQPTVNINISDLAPSLYLVNIITTEKTYTVKLLVKK